MATKSERLNRHVANGILGLGLMLASAFAAVVFLGFLIAIL